MKTSLRIWASALTAAMAISSPTVARDGPETTVAYVGTSAGLFSAWLIDWQQSSRVHVVNLDGNGDGMARSDGARRLITLDRPITVLAQAGEFDACGELPQLRLDTLQLVVTTLSGSVWRGNSTVAEAGTQTTLSGCEAGKVVPFGSLDTPGPSLRHLALRERPEVEDLRAGVALAGPSEQAWDVVSAAGVLQFQAGGLGIFAGSGSVVGAVFNDERWLVIAQTTGTRAYGRLFVDRHTGAEVWLNAQWTAGQPTRVSTLLMVKPDSTAGFGTVAQASRKWESGLFLDSRSPFYISLFPNGSGDRLAVDLDTGAQRHTAITWAFRGQDIQQFRRAGASTQLRTWRPLRNGKDGSRVVMEDEVEWFDGGGSALRFPPRVNFYVDRGAAVAP